MFLNKRINHWFAHFKQFLFTYKDGFFEMSFLGNSPNTIVESIKKMPFTKFSASNNEIVINNIFTDAQMQYFEIEEGLWLLKTKVKSKKNILFRRIYDDLLPIDYYFLGFNNNLTNLSYDKIVVDQIEVENLSWTLYKLKSNDFNCYFKDSVVENFSICFSEEWFKNNFNTVPKENTKFYELLENKSIDYFSVNQLIEENLLFIENFRDFFTTNLKHHSFLRTDALSIINNFINYVNADFNTSYALGLQKRDQHKIFKIQYYLLNNLDKKFVGIDFLSEKFTISPTKLKNDFKTIIGVSVFQYFQFEQMKLAKKILETKEIKIY